MIDTYTSLLEAAASSGDKKTADKAVEALIQHLKSEGRLKMLPQIARELRKIAALRALREPMLEVAHTKGERKALASAKEAGIDAKKTVINPALISGWRARSHDAVVDRSGKRALLEIYQTLI